jgi:hypothetical protein
MSNNNVNLQLLDELLNSDVEENRILGSLLLSTVDLPREEIMARIKPTLDEFIKNREVNADILNNFISIYNNLTSEDVVKNRVKKL